MSIKSNLIKFAIKITPNGVVKFVGNWVLKGIAELRDYSFDLDQRKFFAEVHLAGEDSSIEVLLENFEIHIDEGNYRFILNSARSNKEWLNKLMARFTGKSWPIPDLPQIRPYYALLAELLEPQTASAKIEEETVEIQAEDPAESKAN